MAYIRFCAIHIPFFSLQVWLRDHPDRKDQPLIMALPGHPSPQMQQNPLARRLRIPATMDQPSLQKRWPQVHVIPYDHQIEQEALRRLLELFQAQTPAARWLGQGDFLLDLAGTARLHGTDQREWLQRLLLKVKALGYGSLRAAMAPSGSSARLLAQISHPPRALCVSVQDLPSALGHVPLSVIPETEPSIISRMRSEGLRTLRDLQVLDRRQVLRHWGATGEYLYALAQGLECAKAELLPVNPEQQCSIIQDYEPGITLRPSLRHAGRELGQSLHENLKQQGKRCSRLEIRARLSDGRLWNEQTKVDSTKDLTASLLPLLETLDLAGANVTRLECRALRLRSLPEQTPLLPLF